MLKIIKTNVSAVYRNAESCLQCLCTSSMSLESICIGQNFGMQVPNITSHQGSFTNFLCLPSTLVISLPSEELYSAHQPFRWSTWMICRTRHYRHLKEYTKTPSWTNSSTVSLQQTWLCLFMLIICGLWFCGARSVSWQYCTFFSLLKVFSGAISHI